MSFDRLIADTLKAIKPVFDKAARRGLHGEMVPAVAMALCQKAGALLTTIPMDDRANAVERACYHIKKGAGLQ